MSPLKTKSKRNLLTSKIQWWGRNRVSIFIPKWRNREKVMWD
jgi:hypothetical protein